MSDVSAFGAIEVLIEDEEVHISVEPESGPDDSDGWVDLGFHSATVKIDLRVFDLDDAKTLRDDLTDVIDHLEATDD